MCEDTKGVIRSRKSKDRQHNDQMKKDKQRDCCCYFLEICIWVLKSTATFLMVTTVVDLLKGNQMQEF
jgi:hypothetical protein